MRAAPCFTARRTHLGEYLLFAPSYQMGSATPDFSSTERSSGNPPPNDFRACAITATDVMTPPPLVKAALRHLRGDPALAPLAVHARPTARYGSPGSRRRCIPRRSAR